MPLDEAKKLGAMALFGEKYGKIVRVVSVGDFSMELCGGSHVSNVGEIGSFRIISEGGIGSGVRRIEAITGKAAYEAALADRKLLAHTAELLKGKEEDIPARIEKLEAALKEAKKEVQKLKSEQARDSMGNILSKAQEKNGIPFLAAVVAADNMNELRKIADMVKDKLPGGAFILGCASGDKVNLVGMAADEAVQHGIHMGKVVSRAAKICNGGGGGKPGKAQAGGKDVTKLEAAITEGAKAIAEMIG